jgi:hypothetical protein
MIPKTAVRPMMAGSMYTVPVGVFIGSVTLSSPVFLSPFADRAKGTGSLALCDVLISRLAFRGTNTVIDTSRPSSAVLVADLASSSRARGFEVVSIIKKSSKVFLWLQIWSGCLVGFLTDPP